MIPKVRVGDTVAIDLMVNSATGQKIVDYLTLRHTGTSAPVQPHDFSLADAELSVNEARVSINGKLVEATAHNAGGIRLLVEVQQHFRILIVRSLR